jgi:hypothetical protein
MILYANSVIFVLFFLCRIKKLARIISHFFMDGKRMWRDFDFVCWLLKVSRRNDRRWDNCAFFLQLPMKKRSEDDTVTFVFIFAFSVLGLSLICLWCDLVTTTMKKKIVEKDDTNKSVRLFTYQRRRWWFFCDWQLRELIISP